MLLARGQGAMRGNRSKSWKELPLSDWVLPPTKEIGSVTIRESEFMETLVSLTGKLGSEEDCMVWECLEVQL